MGKTHKQERARAIHSGPKPEDVNPVAPNNHYKVKPVKPHKKVKLVKTGSGEYPGHLDTGGIRYGNKRKMEAKQKVNKRRAERKKNKREAGRAED